MSHKFDVFLSHNSSNRAFVQALHDELGRWGVRSWLDSIEITSGDTILAKIDEGLKDSRTIAVLLGAEGFGRYQIHEQYAAVAMAIEKGVRVIPVLIPGYDKTVADQLPSFLAVRKWAEFVAEATERAPLQELLSGVLKDAEDDRLERFLTSPAGTRRAQDPPDDPAVRMTNKALGELASTLKRFKTLTVFIGAGAGEPRPYEIARQLLTDLRFIDGEYGALLPSMEAAGSYYEIDKPFELETRVVDLITRNARQEPQQARLYALIAKLVGGLRTAWGKNKVVQPPLIVTTALDLNSERALLRAGVPFTRIIQHWTGDRLTINEYKNVLVQGTEIVVTADGEESRFEATDSETMDSVIATHGQQVIRAADETHGTPTHPITELGLSQFQTDGQLTRPILYKYHGSLDAPGSCALSSDQYFRLAVRRAIPNGLVEMIGNSGGLFFPCGGLDSDVRHAYQTLLRRAYHDGREGLPRYAVVRPARDPEPDSYRRLEMKMWPRVIDAVKEQMQITVLETSPEVFVTQLIERLGP